jgi:hypothetical protein
MTIKETISEWLSETQELMIKKYDELGFRASGDWAKSLENEVTEGNEKYTGTISGANYTYWMEHGRKPGKFPPRAFIIQWIQEKPIYYKDITLNSLAFLIARKIARDGTKVRPGIVSDVITQSHVQDLYNRIGQVFINEVKSDVIKELKA